MSAGVWIGIGLLGGLGACARVLLGAAVDRRAIRTPYFPWGTLAVNLLGAFAIGLLAGAGLGRDAYLLAAAGFLGGFTTFSTWVVDARLLVGRAGPANIGVSLVLGLLAVWLGRKLGAVLF